jgi:hypothetical protein
MGKNIDSQITRRELLRYGLSFAAVTALCNTVCRLSRDLVHRSLHRNRHRSRT